MALLIKEDAKGVHVAPENGTNFTLDEMYKMLDCTMVQILPAGEEGLIMVADEEGLYKNPPTINQVASKMVGHGIVGHVLVCKDSEVR